MQTTTRKTDTKPRIESKEETRKQDDKLKRSVYTISTPRDFVQKSTTADIYAHKKKNNVQNAKAPKKVPGITNTTSNVSPMKGLLKSSASSVSQVSRTEKIHAKRNETKASLYSARKNETPRKQPLTNVTVNSPAAKRQLESNLERISRSNKEVVTRKSAINKGGAETKVASKQTIEIGKTKEVQQESTKDVFKIERHRTKTRTLDENEVKILTADVVDNNAGMMNLSQKLAAQPKAFYVDLDLDKSEPKKDKSSDEDVSYADDFESYESDFDSYHSDQTDSDATSAASDKSDTSEQSEQNEQMASTEDSSLKERKDEEKMLDSGNFDLRDQRSSKSKTAVMDFILEDAEDNKTISLTDEGFQDMSSGSAASSMRTFERPLFLDFTKSKQNRIKRKINERLKQRAKDLLGMITLHEMSYSLFEMQPISYDLYMATFGRSNYTQSGVQTFDDGITEEIQTEEVVVCQKWTQHPVEFSKNYVYLKQDNGVRNFSKHSEDYLSKFTFLMKQNGDDQDSKHFADENYQNNPLRILFEQRDGAGRDEMLPYETYKSKLKTNDYNSNKLGKFLKKRESTISLILNSNSGDKNGTKLAKSNKLPFSTGYISLSAKTIPNEKLSFLKNTIISRIVFSYNKLNLILTIHKMVKNVCGKRSYICLWDLSVASEDPIKVLTAIDEVIIGRFSGNVDGMFVAGLKDGSIHLWDLSEEPTWQEDPASQKNPTELVGIQAERLTEIEKDREWNLRNSSVGLDQSQVAVPLQSSAFTNSGANMTAKEEVDQIVGLEMSTDCGNLESGRRIVGQVISLQRIGILTIWSVIQDKIKSTYDIGKATLSKIKLEKHQTIHLNEQIDISTRQNLENEGFSFSLNAAKKRLSLRKRDKNIIKNQSSRPQSAISSKFDFDIDRPSSAASLRKRVMPVDIINHTNWETGMVCRDLKVIKVKNIDIYLVAKNCGEVLCCKKCFGAVKTERFTVAADTSTVTNLEVSSNGLPYFLAATDTGTVNLCSLLNNRVLLTLDCRNLPSHDVVDKCRADHKGRFISSVTERRSSSSMAKLEIKSVHWSPVNPCSVYVLLQDGAIVVFELTHSDIYAKYVCNKAAVECTAKDVNLALLTPEEEVQVHRLANELTTKENLSIFEKYVALL